MEELKWLDIFGDNLVDLMKEAEISQAELAQRAGISQATLSKYINKLQMPGVKAIVNLSYALECTTDDLIDFGEPIE